MSYCSCGNACTTSCGTGCSAACSGCQGACIGCSGCSGCSKKCSSVCYYTVDGGGCIDCSGGCTGECTSCWSSCRSGCASASTSSCNNYCSGGCSSKCDGCTSGCYGSCKSACGGSCVENCSSGCGDGCSNACTAGCANICASACDNNNCQGSCTGGCGGCGGCGYGCTNSCLSYCNSGCSNGAMTNAYNDLQTLAEKVTSSQMINLRALLMHELARYNKTINKTNKDNSAEGVKIIYGTSSDRNTGIEVDDHIKTLAQISESKLTNGKLSLEEFKACRDLIMTSYASVIKYSSTSSKGTAGHTYTSSGSVIDESSYNPWA